PASLACVSRSSGAWSAFPSRACRATAADAPSELGNSAGEKQWAFLACLVRIGEAARGCRRQSSPYAYYVRLPPSLLESHRFTMTVWISERGGSWWGWGGRSAIWIWV